MSHAAVSNEPVSPDGPPRSPLVELLLLAAPTVAQMASYTVMQFADTYMLARVGDLHATAAGQGGLASFSLISFGVGVVMLVNTLVSQSFGRKDFTACGQYLWQGVWFSLAFGLLVLPLMPFALPAFRAVGHRPELAALEASYFQITLAFAAFKLTAMSLGQFLLAVNRPNSVLLAAAVAATSNIFFNWLLIYGNWGFPKMGVAGAAWGTNLAVLVEMFILVAIIARPALARQYAVRDWRARRPLMRTLLAVGLPSGVQIVAEVVAWALFTIFVVALFDVPSMAANNYAVRYMSVSFMPAFGLSAAVTALVGRYIGMGRPDVAMRRAHLGFAVAAVYTVSCGVFFYVFRYDLIRAFSNDTAVLRAGATLLVFAAAFQIFDAMYIIYNGALRGAGDTFVPAVVIAVMCWGVTVFGGYAVAKLRPDLGVAGPWSAALAYGIILGIYLLLRFSRGQWKSIRLAEHTKEVGRQDSREDAPALPDVESAPA